MDTPSVKLTYSAEVTVPRGLTCLMSCLSKDSEDIEDKTLFRFYQPVVIPAYLIAIVVGALEKRDISDRCCVWAEPSVVEKARYEFEDTELMLKAAEDLMGPYEWGRYDLVVLPHSFPFGGMENPCLTFVTPTIIAGDRSVAYFIKSRIVLKSLFILHIRKVFQTNFINFNVNNKCRIEKRSKEVLRYFKTKDVEILVVPRVNMEKNELKYQNL